MEEFKMQDILVEGETIIWEEKPDEVCYKWTSVIPMLPFAILWGMFDFGFIYMILKSGQASAMLWFIIPFFALHLMPVWMVIGQIIKNGLEYPNVVYAITDRRVILRDGFIGIDFKSFDYSEIDNVNVNVNILEKIRNVGTVSCKVDSVIYKIISIKEPYKVYKMLQKIMIDVKTDMNYPNALRPNNNPGYNTEYTYEER